MTVKIVFDGRFPGIGAATKRVRNYVTSLAKLGVEVEVVPIAPWKNHLLFQFIAPLFTVWKLWSRREQADIFLVYGFGWLSKFLLILFARFKKAAIVFEVNEKPYSIRGSGRRDVLLKHIAPLNYWCLTRLVFPLADGFIVISERLRELVAACASDGATLVKIPIIVDYEYYQGMNCDADSFERPYMLHAATLNDAKEGILDVFRAFALVHEEHGIPLHFYLANRVGLSSVVRAVDELISEHKLSRFVHFLETPKDETLTVYQCGCDFTVINKTDTEQNRHNFATKIGEFLALGRPIITTGLGEVKYFLEDGVSCLYVDPGSPRQIAEKIALLINNSELCTSIGENGRRIAAERLAADSQAPELKRFLETTAARRNKRSTFRS